MNRQQLLNNVVSRIGNKGRSGRTYGDGGYTCLYVPSMFDGEGVTKDHPGCAIGCQPCFDDPSLKEILHKNEGKAIHTILTCEKRIANALEVNAEDGDQISFLLHMQRSLHDHETSWNKDGTLRQLAVNDFANTYGLTPPIVPSIG